MFRVVLTSLLVLMDQIRGLGLLVELKPFFLMVMLIVVGVITF
jgi:hypothetical protein